MDEVGVPSTIRGVIAARIDGLSADRRRVLREVSVVGRDFLHRLVHQVTDRPDGLDASLLDLVGADLIRGTAIDPELEYAFKHALTQEVAYEGLPRRDREALHERVARAIESALADRTGEFAETLAYHYERSGHVEEVVTYLQRSGRKALDRYALAEADSHYRNAYALLIAETGSGTGPVDPARRDRLLLELILDWAQVHYYQGRFGDLHQLVTAHAELPERVGDDGLHARWLAWSGHLVINVLGGIRESIRLLEEAAALAERSGDVTAEAYALAWLPWSLYPAGRTREVPALWERLQALLPAVPDLHHRRYAHIKGLGGAATTAVVRGRTREARDLARDLLAVGGEQGKRRGRRPRLPALGARLVRRDRCRVR